MIKNITLLIRKLRSFLKEKFKQYDVTLPYIITFVVALVVVVGGINLFIELTETLKSELLADYDQQITQYVLSHRSPALTKYFIFVTHLGDVYGYLIVVGIFTVVSIFVFKRWKYIIQIFLVLALSALSNLILKRFVDRARPGIEHMVSVETLSYPSGHAMSAMAFYGFLMYLFYRFKINVFLKTGIIVLLGILILSIGFSRIYLGVHFPSDVAGGYIAGFIWVVFCVLLFNLIEVFRRDPQTTTA
ncbi:undecaprenyl-diphosphatase [Gelidibacter algens]|jgi:undecaprenyl-diphosphatase|uniref:Undecaprenyl-diphosphatase n=1 Tax=Gelidibacter algens TaxID=49280 RepID=A0A1A7QYI4_9FLAO|nr:phosphatase PAP2 family protein [Gelidibacter algens]OBX24621.1 phosphatidic acid phosphatase [Gelidibacter algens]RAJ27771.1 undecaprenyl-diphosphatase [Gelidibacter algens]